MSDSQDVTLPPATPSGLLTSTRSEVEAALTFNTAAQTDSAAPTTPPPSSHKTSPTMVTDVGSEAQDAYYRRRYCPARTSSANYVSALHEAHKQASASSDLSTDTTLCSPISPTVAFPLPGQGVVPLRTGVEAAQAEGAKKSQSRGLSLSDLGWKQFWSSQDHKHIMQAELMGEVDGNAGYGSGGGAKGAGPS